MSTGFLPSYPGARSTGSSPATVVEVDGVEVDGDVEVEVDRDVVADVDRELLGVVVVGRGTPVVLVDPRPAGVISCGVD